MPSFARRLLLFTPLLVALIIFTHVVTAFTGTTAGPATLVKDIQTPPPDVNYRAAFDSMFSSGDVAYYFVVDRYRGIELWKSDGTTDGTVMVRTIRPPNRITSRFFEKPFFTKVGDTTFFVANDGEHGIELWKTDGTEDGTHLVKDIKKGPDSSIPYYLKAAGNKLFFVAYDGLNGLDLWTSDGTEGGTIPLKGNRTDLFVDGYGLTDVNGTLFVFMVSNTSRWSLIKSDGTPEGTVRVYDFGESCGLGRSVGSMNGIVYFMGCGTPAFPDAQLWRSDGTAAGTFRITTLSSVPPKYYFVENKFVVFNNALYFSMNTKLWRTTGLTETTEPVLNTLPLEMTVWNNRLFFTTYNGENGSELWVTDSGTTATLVKDINPGSASSDPYSFVPTSNGLVFTADDGIHGGELWRTDGTTEGTVLVKDILPGPGRSIPYHKSLDTYDDVEKITWGLLTNGQMVFIANDGIAYSLVVWRTDGTNEGTVQVHDPSLASNSTVLSAATDLQGTLVFNALSENTFSLWRSDGTEAGTVPLSPTVQMNTAGVVIDRTLFFAQKGQLWRSDGTFSGTKIIGDFGTNAIVDQLVALNGTLYFRANDMLWRSDGTTASIVANVSPIHLVAANGLLYFSTISYSNGIVQSTMYRSDGTATGTFSIGQNEGSVHEFVVLGGELFFAVTNASFELWKVDGTSQQTNLITSIPLHTTSQGDTSTPILRRVGNMLFFTVSDTDHGNELWVSDGTTIGTHLVRDIMTGQASSFPESLVDMNGLLYFTAISAEGGRELWRSDGTERGTVQVKDIAAGNLASNPSQLLATSDDLFFVATDILHGRELWRSDGTEQGTTLVQDINPGAASAFAKERNRQLFPITSSGGRLFFQANDGIHGDELWSLKLNDVVVPTSSPTSSVTPGNPTTTVPSGPTATPERAKHNEANRVTLPFIAKP